MLRSASDFADRCARTPRFAILVASSGRCPDCAVRAYGGGPVRAAQTRWLRPGGCSLAHAIVGQRQLGFAMPELGTPLVHRALLVSGTLPIAVVQDIRCRLPRVRYYCARILAPHLRLRLLHAWLVEIVTAAGQ